MVFPQTLLLSAGYRFYKKILKRPAKKLGLHDIFAEKYVQFIDSYTRSVNGTTAIFTVSDLDDLSYFKTDREQDVLEDLLRRIRSDDIFFDIGSNVGLYSCLVGTQIVEGRVVAFEPVPDIASRLQDNLHVNGLTDQSEVRECVLADGTGQTKLARRGDRASESTIAASDIDSTITVPMTRGDDIVQNAELPQPTVVKIDVEGAELRVLRGMKETLAADTCRLLYCEIHREKLPQHNATPANVETFLESLGFQLQTIHERRNGYFIRGQK